MTCVFRVVILLYLLMSFSSRIDTSTLFCRISGTAQNSYFYQWLNPCIVLLKWFCNTFQPSEHELRSSEISLVPDITHLHKPVMWSSHSHSEDPDFSLLNKAAQPRVIWISSHWLKYLTLISPSNELIILKAHQLSSTTVNSTYWRNEVWLHSYRIVIGPIIWIKM